jgi:hypothetical protein
MRFVREIKKELHNSAGDYYGIRKVEIELVFV